ncbi:hypothetical protein, partial [Actinoallomurus sp. NPDC052274]|uniref:hypothetical protein n=1 Tax=Actinoallomurus sp. NPDC052274 TaxID=3155420 RepID=UPI00343B7A07
FFFFVFFFFFFVFFFFLVHSFSFFYPLRHLFWFFFCGAGGGAGVTGEPTAGRGVETGAARTETGPSAPRLPRRRRWSLSPAGPGAFVL